MGTQPPGTQPPEKTPRPTAPSSLSPTTCPPSDPILISNEGETMYPELPVVITSQSTTHVSFQVKNTFGSMVSSVFTEYHSGSFGETECLEDEDVEQNSLVENHFIAQCTHHTKISIVNVWITDCNDALPFLDGDLDNAEVPECCHPGSQCRTVQYTFKLPCVSTCPKTEVPYSIASTNGLRRNLVSKSNESASMEVFEAVTEHQEPDDFEEEHFCIVEDYPCGPNNDKVHVCHYSARDGYKTFCVPEPDSDALRFYPKDYCGPCVGGYATSS